MSKEIREMIDKVRNIKTGTYNGTAGGNMGTISRQYVAGKKNTYKKDEFIIDEFIPRADLKQDQTKSYIVKGFADDEFLGFKNAVDWNDVYKKVDEIRNKELNIINSTDLTKAIEFMKKNEAGFVKIMKHIQESENLSKPLAFLNLIKDYYKNNGFIFTIEVIAKIMIKYGYDFKSFKEIRDLYYKEY
jgi:hypothetical protein